MKNLLTTLGIISLIAFSGCSQTTTSVKKDVKKATQQSKIGGAEVMSEKDFQKFLKSQEAIKK